ncbi:Repeat domain in Vibrio, Colwellia, Bradyrhizobium and Shewanella [Shewanella psychrophila]|uniref:Repeat domain in Vibrio, Colwellia, Bradyrhizobium and Shewanella n=1 Tax=Shewanella psychrophila TaxID=225848 RepID=A0A1S6HXH4_9GAMM|nr:VCBS repeat-containing protein [Shewanella psychrophila]AQS40286.1 Repeat domain in Vibrio, Colwellia, Bradyrhizobium and Shewanella [Shewanella psychrophila]
MEKVRNSSSFLSMLAAPSVLALPVLLLPILAMASFGANSASKNSGVTLESHSVETSFKLTHPILPANLLAASGKELVTFGVDDSRQKWLTVFSFDKQEGKYTESLKVKLPRELASFDLTGRDNDRSSAGATKTDDVQQLMFLSSQHLIRFVPSDKLNPFHIVADISSMSLKHTPDYISGSDFIRDLNGDGLDDIIISDFDGVELFIAQIDGSYHRQQLPIKPQVRLYNDGARYTQSKLYSADINLDGKPDIVKIGEGELEVYRQKESGHFDPIAKYSSVRLAISGLDWWNKRDAYGEQLDQSDLVYRKVEELKDINNDGFTDMVVRYTKSSGVLDRVNDYEIYLGENIKGQLTFPKKPNSVIRADGTLTGLEFIDIDGDNKDEVLVAGFDIGLSQIIGALISGNIDQDVYLFKMDENSRFSDDANISKEVELSFSLTSGQSGSPVVKLADINGDGLQDLLLSDGDDTLQIFLGSDSGRLFVKRSEKIRVQLPQDGGMVSSQDLNGDGKEDLIIKYGQQDDESLQNKFKVILANPSSETHLP